MTMTNAEWMIKNGIQFKNLCIVTSLDAGIDSVGYYDTEGFHECYKGKRLGNIVSETILAWLDMEHVEQILDDVERRYLAAVIKPFRNRVVFIRKDYISENYEQIIIRVKSITASSDIADIPLPFFKAGEMYKSMKMYKEYTPEELGL